MLALLLLLQAISPDVIVTGKRLEEAQSLCARGACDPLRDAQASIALAEARFRSGGYREAKDILWAAILRNRRHAATDPKPVAAIYEAYATVALHDGDLKAYRIGVAGRVRTLRDHLPGDDTSVIAASSALGDMWINLENFRQADAAFDAVERDASRAGLARTAMIAGMKRVWLAAAMGNGATARLMLAQLYRRPIAREQAMRTALDVLALRIATRQASEQDIDRLVQQVKRTQGEPSALIYAPRWEERVSRTATRNASVAFRERDIFQPVAAEVENLSWIDVGFWIRPDGTTGDIAMLRSTYKPWWTGIALRQIAGRRYTALANADGADQGLGIYRIERITKRTRYVKPVNSLIERHVAADGYEVLDLTGPPSGKAG
ncbi:tetratricopeptide (TPR) repeat protein [Sphingomonas jinjuensis]|uniref:Tetratricopeptide (TPR) repeat protein n=1 Tax=Sphingomonas jinjuensis TaxID=535907 RepID=A0A840F6U4_9SPHN|nr:hypothetical protein [Sphingomonas jinjuensis]MBB4153459.1 tetratricopeptide (TPR) repeat protein [Sphingomonas jinjuensis]